MTTATLIPLAEYLHTSYDPDCEWVDGELLERNLGEFDHSTIQRLILKFFLLREDQLGIAAYPELRLQVSATNYRVPDILLLPLGVTYQHMVLDPPLLCIEVLSPEDRMSRMQNKVADYIAMGVPCLWIVDPAQRSALQVDADGQQFVQELTLPGYDVHLKLSDLFGQTGPPAV